MTRTLQHEHTQTDDLFGLLTSAGMSNPQAGFTFLGGDGIVENCLSFSVVAESAHAVAAALRNQGLEPGDRAMLLFEAGLDYITAFFGCLAAGVVAVPLYPPSPSNIEQLDAIAADCTPSAVLTTGSVALPGSAETARFGGRDVPIIVTGVGDSAPGPGEAGVPGRPAYSEHARVEHRIAYLQYTSGSTGTPKGVIVDHAMAIEQCREIADAWSMNAESVIVSWLPHFHDFGQVTGVLLPTLVHCKSVLMAPSTFVKSPIVWLRAVTEHGGTHSGAPNFAYDRCVDGTDSGDRRDLDLSTWRHVANGAEPIRAATLRRFVDTFAPYGLQSTAPSPGYGLAEATLKVTSKPSGRPYVTTTFDADALRRGSAEPSTQQPTVELVACGGTVRNTELLIVDPVTRQPMPHGSVGEIWIRGPIVSPGYWSRSNATRETFEARPAGSDAMYLRSGDLGFLYDNELYICGRLKSMLVINGVNHHLEDIEATVVDSHADLRPGGVVGFGLESRENESEAVVVVVEHRDTMGPFDAIAAAVRTSVSARHQLAVASVLLIARGSVARTTSGKLRRQKCRTDYLNGALAILERWDRSHIDPQPQPAERRTTLANSLRDSALATISEWLRTHHFDDVDTSRAPSEIGMSSVDHMDLHQHLESWSGTRIEPETVFEATSFDELARGVVSAVFAHNK